MLFVLISCFSFILLSYSIYRNPLSLRNTEMKLLFLPFFWVQFSSFLVSWFGKSSLSFSAHQVPVKMSPKKVKVEKVVEEDKMSLLDLPELALDCILERLSPAGLCRMAGVCTSLRERCRDDRLWEKHMKQKWGRVIGDAAYREWQWHIALQRRPSLLNQSKQKGLFQSLCPWPSSFMRQKLNSSSTPTSSLPVYSIMSWYLSLESGKFWFPAQVYNREHGHAGFMLSCYDAQLCYDSQTGTFLARYLPLGLRTIEENVQWHRLRAPPVDTPAHVLHLSDCLDDLKPGDHIEIQWRRNKEFPYGWWYGIVSHLESCEANKSHCRCQYSDTVILEFSQYMPGSRWRSTAINRKDHREEGNEEDGFYGGIRKIYKEEEVSMWKRLRPTQVLE